MSGAFLRDGTERLDRSDRPSNLNEDPTQEELDDFVIENRQWLTEEAEDVLRKMNLKDQRSVIEEGSMSNCRDPVAIVKSRAWQGHLKRNREWVEDRKAMPLKQLIEDFLEANAAVMTDEAEEVLLSLSPSEQRQVVEVGSLAGCRDPVAIIKTRARQGKGKKGKGKGKGKGKAEDGWGAARRDGWDGRGDAWGGRGWRGGRESDWEWPSFGGGFGSRGQGPGGGFGPSGQGPGGGFGSSGPSDEARAEMEREEKKNRHKEAIQMENLAAVNEGRSLYVVGLPPLWTPNQLLDFFSHQGKVLRAHMMAVKPGTGSRAAFVNFVSAEDATSAAEVCDQLEVEDRGETYTLTCSIKQRTGEKTYGKKTSPAASGGADHHKARDEMRVAFVSRLPLEVDEVQIRGMAEPYGAVEDVYLLPSNNINQACFITMASAGGAGLLIQGLHGASVGGSVLVACYPREREDKKRKRVDDQGDEYVVEIRNFPHWTETEDLRAVLESSKHEVQRLRILNHDPKGQASLARAHLTSAEAMHEVVRMLNGFEFTPGYPLQLAAVPPASQRNAVDLGAAQAWAGGVHGSPGLLSAWAGSAIRAFGQWSGE